MRAGKLSLWLRGGVCCLFVLCLALARAAALELEGLGLEGIRVLRLHYPASALDAKRIMEDERLEEHPVSFALWGQRESAYIMNTGLGRSAFCDVVELCGSSGLVFASGAPLPEDEPDCCLLDRATALELFGSASPGSAVSVAGAEYRVCGILESSRPVIVVPGSQQAQLSCLTLRAPEGDPPKMAAEAFAQRHGLLGELSEPGLPALLGRGASMLPAVFLLLGVIGRSTGAAMSPRAGRLGFWLGLGLAGAVWFLLLWVTDFSFWVPQEMIPNKWSDFDFWGQLLEEKRVELIDAVSRGQTAPELAVLLPVLRAGAWGLLGAALTPLLPRPKTWAQAWVWCAAGGALAFMAAVYLEGGLSRDKALWLTLPVGMLGRWAAFSLGKHGRYIKKYSAARKFPGGSNLPVGKL